MNKKTITFISLLFALVGIAYAVYNSFSQLKDIDYDLFGMDEDYEDD